MFSVGKNQQWNDHTWQRWQSSTHCGGGHSALLPYVGGGCQSVAGFTYDCRWYYE